jgi:HK97 family phage major capsid protein
MPQVTIEYVSGAKMGKTETVEKSIADTYVADGFARISDVGEDPVLTKGLELVAQKNEEWRKQTRKEIVKEVIAEVTKQLGSGFDRIMPSISTYDRINDHPTNGWKNIGEFFVDTVKMQRKNHVSEKMKNYIYKDNGSGNLILKADGMQEGIQTLGGALIPIEFSDQLYRNVMAEVPFMNDSLVRKHPITTGNQLYVRYREITTLGVTNDTQNGFSGGSLGTWLDADGQIINPSAPIYNNTIFTLNRWGTLLPITETLLADNNVALSSFIFEEARIALNWDLNTAFISGNGNGQPTGLLNGPGIGTGSGPCLILQPTSGDPNFSVQYQDIVNMKASLYTVIPGDFTSARWIINPDVEASLMLLKDAAGRNLYYATGTIDQSSKPKLFGIPVEWAYQCPAVGSVGDIILTDLKQYGVAVKAGEGVQQAVSQHFYFDAAETAFRMITRVDAKSMIPYQMTLPNGHVRSSIVVLGARGGSGSSGSGL